ncbi:MAG TPA: rhomboid family intramembrane serine protease [Candidatus Dormibacteraeota bacterium]|nr:rhomboid family intramembrane serine protease [Candidatus Dormibacteraeota bacterium]
MTQTLGRLLRAALDAALRLADALGARGARWEWKKQAWRQALENRVAAWDNLERGVRARTRMCRECRTLVPRGERTCPSCGASMSGVPSGGIGRLVTLALPGSMTVTTLLITVNIGMSLLILLVWGTGGLSAGPMRFLSPPGAALYLFGEKVSYGIFHGEAWRLVTANYLHGGLLHLLMNCYALATLGTLIEESFGARKFFLVYTVCGVCAFLTSAQFSEAPAVGASGALFGLMGFGIIYGKFRGGAAGRMVAEHLMRWLVYGAVMLFMPGIDNLAHFGGLIAGGLLGAVVPPGEPKSRAAEMTLRLLAGAALLATLGSFAAMALTYGRNLEMLRQQGRLGG